VCAGLAVSLIRRRADSEADAPRDPSLLDHLEWRRGTDADESPAAMPF